MNQLQEINILFKKRLEQLEKKKQKCMDYSSTPNRCVNRVQAQIDRTQKLARISKIRTRSMESKVIVDSYLELVQEGRPKSPMGKLAVGAVGVVGGYKAAKWGVKRSDCKEYKYSPYLHKRCMKGLEEAEIIDFKKRKKEIQTGRKQSKKAKIVKTTKFLKKIKKHPLGLAAGAIALGTLGTDYAIYKNATKKKKRKKVKESMAAFRAIKKSLRANPEVRRSIEAGIELDKDKAYKKVGVGESESFLDQLNSDTRSDAKEWTGPNIPYGDDSNRPNLIRQCTMMEDTTQKINCLRKLRDQAAMNPFYQYRIDRYIDEITDTYEPTKEPGTIPGNEFKETGVGEDTSAEPVTEALSRGELASRTSIVVILLSTAYSLYTRGLRKAAKNCAGLDTAGKNDCMKAHKINAIQQEINFLKTRITSCKKEKNSEKCQNAVMKRIRNREISLNKLKKQYKLLHKVSIKV